ncbi:MAG: hypothetical protein KDC26_11590 [Armatimonadetes bacterium]|nr:hypothetical protein [Armatimonadota bacterium]
MKRKLVDMEWRDGIRTAILLVLGGLFGGGLLGLLFTIAVPELPELMFGPPITNVLGVGFLLGAMNGSMFGLVLAVALLVGAGIAQKGASSSAPPAWNPDSNYPRD